MSKNRDFKGVWIPKEIYLDDNLNWTEKILLIEIDSLDNENGCYASNEYFADFLSKSKVYISNCISKLKKDGYIRQESFDGRTRVLKSNLRYITNNNNSDNKAALNSSLRQGKGIVKGGETGSSQDSHSRKEGKNASINTYNNIQTEEEKGRGVDLNIPAKIKQKFEQIFGKELSKELYQKLLKLYSDKKILMKALEVSEMNGDQPSYLLKVLQDWKNKGLTSIVSINTYLENRRSNNGNMNKYREHIKEKSIEEMKENGWK